MTTERCFTYHHLQETLSVKTPPISGPTTEASAKVAESELVIAGRIFGLDENEITIKHPAKVPAQPAPVIARPAMNALLFGETATQN
jgi:hypothetical protein